MNLKNDTIKNYLYQELELKLNIIDLLIKELNITKNELETSFYDNFNFKFVSTNFILKKEILLELDNFELNIKPIEKIKFIKNENNEFYKPKLKNKEKKLLEKFPIVSQEEIDTLSNLFGIKNKNSNKINEHLKLIKKFFFENKYDIVLPDYLKDYNIEKIKNKFKINILE